MDVAQAILHGLGYTGTHFELLRADTVPALDAGLRSLGATRQAVPREPARFAVAAEKRATLELALDHLVAQAPARPEAIALPPQGSPFGTIDVDKDRCTLCMSCVSACPSSALLDNPQAPQLRFLEKNCVQCGLCATTCPEDAITLQPRLLLTPQRARSARPERDQAVRLHPLRQAVRHAQGGGGHAGQAGRPRDVPGRRARAPEDVRRLPRGRHLFRTGRSEDHRCLRLLPSPPPRSTRRPPAPRCTACWRSSSTKLPAPDLLDALRVAVTEAPAAGAYLEEPWRVLVGVARESEAGDIRSEYDALFGGVGKPDVYLFGSHYVSGFLNERPLAQLRDDLRELGLTRDEAMPETEDHIAYLCEVMRYLIAGDDVAVSNLARQRDFFAAHLQPWVATMCEAIAAHPAGRLLRGARALHAGLRQRRAAGLRSAALTVG